MRGTPEERFWAKVKKTDTCWLWQSTLNHSGYGVFGVPDGERWKTVGAHRFSWELANGRRIPPGMYICHRCDNPSCVRPDHLFLGSPSDNMQDCLAKGRWMTDARVAAYPRRRPRRPDQSAHGERGGLSKLTNEKVFEIRSRYKGRGNGPTLVELAAEYGVTFGTISHIVRRRTWKHI